MLVLRISFLGLACMCQGGMHSRIACTCTQSSCACLLEGECESLITVKTGRKKTFSDAWN